MAIENRVEQYSTFDQDLALLKSIDFKKAIIPGLDSDTLNSNLKKASEFYQSYKNKPGLEGYDSINGLIDSLTLARIGLQAVIPAFSENSPEQIKLIALEASICKKLVEAKNLEMDLIKDHSQALNDAGVVPIAPEMAKFHKNYYEQRPVVYQAIQTLIAKTEGTLNRLWKGAQIKKGGYESAIRDLQVIQLELQELLDPRKTVKQKDGAYTSTVFEKLRSLNDKVDITLNNLKNDSSSALERSCLLAIKKEIKELESKGDINEFEAKKENRITKAADYLTNVEFKSAYNRFLGNDSNKPLPSRVAKPINAKEHLINLLHDFQEGNISVRGFSAKLQQIEKSSKEKAPSWLFCQLSRLLFGYKENMELRNQAAHFPEVKQQFKDVYIQYHNIQPQPKNSDAYIEKMEKKIEKSAANTVSIINSLEASESKKSIIKRTPELRASKHAIKEHNRHIYERKNELSSKRSGDSLTKIAALALESEFLTQDAKKFETLVENKANPRLKN